MDTFFNILKIVNNLLPSIGVILSAVISYFVANKKAKSEIDKVKLQFNREDKIALEKCYSNFIKGISDYIAINNPPAKDAFLSAWSNFLSIAPDELYQYLIPLDELYHFYDRDKLIAAKNEISIQYLKYRKSTY